MKKTLLWIIGLGILILFGPSCHQYKQVVQTRQDFLSNGPVIDAFTHYKVYVHDSEGTYLLKDPRYLNNAITGTPEKITSVQMVNEIRHPDSRKKRDLHKYDLNIFTSKKINDLSTASNDSTHGPGSTLVLKPEDIVSVSLYAIDKKKEEVTGLAAVLVVAGIVLLIYLFYLLVLAIKYGVNDSSNQSSNSSNQSSNSNSSGNGNGSSGCYIATMVYGDYDAPEVLVLRKFRDEVLQRTFAGRLFIRVYYYYSPKFVARFGGNIRLHRAIRFFLDKWVDRLEK